METITVILPCRNEEGNVVRILQAVTTAIAAAGMDREVIFVDDGSTDRTWDVIQELAGTDQSVKAVRFSRNFGKEAAVAAGLDAASGDAVIIMDADFQHPPDLIVEMVRNWKEQGADVVEAVKRRRGREPFLYRLASKLFYRFLDTASGFEFSGSSDFKLLDGKVVRYWRQLPERNLFFRGLVSWMGLKTLQLTFDVGQRQEGEKQWTTRQLIRLALTGMTAFSSLPLRIVTFLGVVFLVFAVMLGVRALVVKFMYDIFDGITLLILLNLLIGSLVMICLGIIGEYIASIYREVKNRPRYLILERIHLE
jgi:glycosyltransferase involved in cell wall biosynthesis